MDSDLTNVLEFKKPEDYDETTPLVVKKPKNWQGCKHRFYTIDADLRTVE